jgi:hypothetical protein
VRKIIEKECSIKGRSANERFAASVGDARMKKSCIFACFLARGKFSEPHARRQAAAPLAASCGQCSTKRRSRKWRQNFNTIFYVKEFYAKTELRSNGNQKPFKKWSKSKKPDEQVKFFVDIIIFTYCIIGSGTY